MGTPQGRRTAVRAVLLGAVAVAFAPLTGPSGPARAQSETVTGTATAVDGATLTVDGRTVRLYGIVAPLAGQRCRSGALPWLCGAAAKEFLQGLVAGRRVICDVVSAPWARCEIGDDDLARSVVSAGWAVADPGTGDAYREAEAKARADKTGLWSR